MYVPFAVRMCESLNTSSTILYCTCVLTKMEGDGSSAATTADVSENRRLKLQETL